MIDQQALDRDRGDYDLIAQAIEAAGGRIVAGGKVHCPFHDDRTPSGSLWELDGVWRLHCFSGSCDFDRGDVFDIRARAGMDAALPRKGDAERPAMAIQPRSTAQRTKTPAPKKPPRIAPTLADALAWYPDRQREHCWPHCAKVKLANKKWQWLQLTDAGWTYGGPDGLKPLWLTEAFNHAGEDDPIVIPEGEKDADTVSSLGFPAVAHPCGAPNPHHADWSLLKDRIAIVLPDNDPAGVEGAKRLVDELAEICTEVWLVDAAVLGEHKDISDLVESLPESDRAMAVEELLAQAKRVSGKPRPLDDLRAFVDRRSKQERCPGSWGIRPLEQLCPLEGGTLTAVLACPSGGKTTILAQAAIATAEHADSSFLSMEMPPHGRAPLLTLRFVRLLTGIDEGHMRRGRLTRDEQSLLDGLEFPKTLSLDYLSRPLPGVLVERVRSHLDRGSRLVAIDYAQKVRPPEGGTIFDAIAVAADLYDLATEYDAAILLGSQIRREANRATKITMADGKGGGAIEECADRLIALTPDPTCGNLTASLLKNRWGRTGDADLIPRADGRGWS